MAADVGGERGEYKRVILEEIAGEKAEFQVAHGFGDDRLVVGRDLTIGIAEEKGGAAKKLSGSGAGVNRGAGGGEFFVDGVGCDVAVRDIDDVESRALAEEADGRRRGGVARRIKMRGNLRAVAVGFGRADDGINRVGDAGHVLKQLGDLTLFPNELFGVSEVLVLAAAAAGKQRANGRDAVG